MKNVRIVPIVFALLLGFVSSAHATSPKTMIYKADKALAVNPNDAVAYYNRGTGHLNLDEYDLAIADFTKSIELEPKGADAYFNRGMAYRLQRKNAEAIQDYTKAIEIYPNAWSYHYERANARIVTADYDGAAADATDMVRIAGDDPEGYFILANFRPLSLFKNPSK
jgi:tetratricopeptide (TPR) repeat protein